MAHAPASHSACHDHKKSPAYLLVWVWGSTFAAFGRKGVPLITDVIENQMLPLLPANSYLVADNASVHNEIVLCRIFARKNITLVKLPGYSYDLNPIEMVFGQAKAIARFTPGFLKENTMLAIVSAFEQISPLNVRHFYQRSWRVLL